MNDALVTGVPSVLQRILASTRIEVARRREEIPLVQLEREVEQASRDAFARQRRFRGALAGPEIAVIAEFKRRSPSAGVLRAEPDLGAIARAYERGGASAISVLTEGPNFEGSLQDLREARAACDLPLLRKDFIVDPYQLHEALAAGADAVLLIVAALEQVALEELYCQARALDLDVLVEVHDRAELHRALELGADLIGINNRDLRDFSVDVRRTFELLADVPEQTIVVSESGIAEQQQLRELQSRGVHAVLVGESLMRAADPRVALLQLRGAAPGANAGLSGSAG
ncbi:MAG TPA: indole-3-glycerol phosphate synthase TrpC [Solirubrobacteraceae bacterium]